MAGVGVDGTLGQSGRSLRPSHRVAQLIEPDAADIAAYKLGYAKWRKLYPALKNLR